MNFFKKLFGLKSDSSQNAPSENSGNSDQQLLYTNADAYGFFDIKIKHSGKLRVDAVMVVSALTTFCKEQNLDFKYQIMYRTFVDSKLGNNLLCIPLVFSSGAENYAVFFMYTNDDIKRYNTAQELVLGTQYDKCIYFSAIAPQSITEKEEVAGPMWAEDLKYIEDFKDSTEFIVWQKDKKEQDFTSSRIYTLIKATLETMQGYESIFLGSILRGSGVVKEQLRFLPPEEMQTFPMEAPEGRKVLLVTSSRYGIRFLFTLDTPISYVDYFLGSILSFSKHFKTELLKNEIEKDPISNPNAIEEFAKYTTLIQSEERRGHCPMSLGLEFLRSNNDISPYGHTNKTDMSSTNIFDFENYKTEGVTPNARALHAEGRQAGSEGNYEQAMELFLKAHTAVPSWPYPLYDLAFTYLMESDTDNALKYYRLTDEIAPKGFFISKTALYILERERTGEYDTGVLKKLLSLEWTESESEKDELVELLVVEYPQVAAAWAAFAEQKTGLQREQAIYKGLEQACDAETHGRLLISQALMLNEKRDPTKAIEVLGEVILRPNSTLGNIGIAKHLVRLLTQTENTEEYNLIALKEFFDFFEERNPNSNVKLSDSFIEVGNTEIVFKVDVEREQEQGGKCIFAARFDVEIDGQLQGQLACDAIGIGYDKESAQENCFQEWLSRFGVMFSDYLGSLTPAMQIDGYRVYFSPQGFRGERPENFLLHNDVFAKAVLQTSKSELTQKINCVSFMFRVQPKSFEGKAKVNGIQSEPLTEVIYNLDWPSNANCIFKQSVLFVK